MRLQHIFFIPVFFICLSGFCQKGDLSPIFDISPDGNTLVVAIASGTASNLYLYSLTEDKLIALTSDNAYYSRPVFSPKGDQLIFLLKNLEAQTSDLCVLDLTSKKITKLTDGKTYVTEAAFMPDGKKIIYCGAGTITNYSPMARKAPHNLDLYSIASSGGAADKLTNFSAYEFGSITPNKKGDTLLCKLIVKGVEGIYLLSLADTVKTKIEAVNNPRPAIGESFYGSPAYSNNNTQISFTAPYQLYTMDLADKTCVEIWSTFGKDDQAMPIFSKFDATDQKVFFSVLPIVKRQYSRSAQLYSYNLATKKLSALSIPKTD